MKQKNFRKAVNLVQFVFSAHLLHFRKQVERLSITLLLDVTTQLQKLFHFLASRTLHSSDTAAIRQSGSQAEPNGLSSLSEPGWHRESQSPQPVLLGLC